MRLIVVEGPDGAGKSTLVKLMAEELGRTRAVRVVHTGPPAPDVDLYTVYWRAVYECRSYDVTIFDRLHVGELVYGPLLRGGSRITLQDAMEIDRTIRSMDGLRIHLTAPFDVLKARRADEVDPLSGAGPSVAQSVWATYRTLLGRPGRSGSLPGWAAVDTTGDPIALAHRLCVFGGCS